MPDYEKLGVFYLGRRWDAKARKTVPELLLYDSKDLTTHGVCVGMTGSGKTGLCIGLLEEAAIDGIPALAIDPKGDLANLALTFPSLAADDFLPWMDSDEATRQGLTAEQLAEKTAASWKKGLEDWEQDGGRIARFREACEVAIYTPASKAGRPLALLRAFTAPSQAVVDDEEALRARVQGAVSGLLALAGIESDPMQGHEHILLARLLQRAWSGGRDLDLAGLIQAVQRPPFDKVGVLDLESFYPAKERAGLALALNNVLASPGAAAWAEGEPLDIQKLLWTPAGKPRIAVLSIAHLSDAQRMFFVTTLLSEVLAWMRTQSGTGSLRALVYMDEIFGYFPPIAAPPSKLPMLTLLKQARAFGVGVLLATQNPVDLDYKGLANAGTWFIGRLQTERDKLRVLDGLQGAMDAASHAFDRQEMDRLLSGLGSRVFLLNDVHEDAPELFQTRWTLSYLRGPLDKEQIKLLSAGQRGGGTPAEKAAVPARTPSAPTGGGRRPVLPAGISEAFLPATPGPGALSYRPAILGQARLHYVDKKAAVDAWQSVALLAPVDGTSVEWDEATELPGDAGTRLGNAPAESATFEEPPAAVTNAGAWTEWKKSLAATLYQARPLKLFRCDALDEVSTPGESLSEFKARLAHSGREQRDADVEALRRKWAPKLQSLQSTVQRAQKALADQQTQASGQTLDTMVTVGTTILGAFLGRKTLSVTNLNRARTALRSGSRTVKERQDIGTAQQQLEAARKQLADTEAEFQEETEKLQAAAAPETLSVVEFTVPPRKSDIAVGTLILAWTPWRTGADGLPAPASALD
ncbi:MAG: ATP-binding protein [Myxococcaceae bacterium]|nr:MAG: ATP-binding protein [Myxococcaceae bacterium]